MKSCRSSSNRHCERNEVECGNPLNNLTSFNAVVIASATKWSVAIPSPQRTFRSWEPFINGLLRRCAPRNDPESSLKYIRHCERNKVERGNPLNTAYPIDSPAHHTNPATQDWTCLPDQLSSFWIPPSTVFLSRLLQQY